MRNDPIFQYVADSTKDLPLAELKVITPKDISTEKLSSEDIKRLNLYFPTIQKGLVHSVELANIEEAKNEMVNKLLLAGTSMTIEEAQLAVEKIFEERSKQSGLWSTE